MNESQRSGCQTNNTSGSDAYGAERPTRERRNVCCSVLFAAYYFGSTSRDTTVLVSSLSASPAWLDMVRQMNKDILCDSIAWTDFGLTTETAYSFCGLDPLTDESEEECIPPRAKVILRRYFYDEFCHRLATKYGIPSLLVFRDRLKRGIELDEYDQHYRWFIDSMLCDARFVAALEITRPAVEVSSCEQESTQQQQVESDERVCDERRDEIPTVAGVQEGVVNERDRWDISDDSSVFHADEGPFSFDYTNNEYEFSDADLSFLPVLERDITRGPQEKGGISTMTESDIYNMFEKYEMELESEKRQLQDTATVTTKSSNIPTEEVHDTSTSSDITGYTSSSATNRMQVQKLGQIAFPLLPGSETTTGKSEVNIGNQLPTSQRLSDDMLTQGYGDGEAMDVDCCEEKTNPEKISQPADALNDKGDLLFKRPLRVGDKTEGRRSSSQQRRLFRELGNRVSKENIDISDDDRILSDTSSDDDMWRATSLGGRAVSRSSRKRDRFPSKYTASEQFDIVGVDLVGVEVTTPDPDQLVPDTLLFVYRLERRSENSIRFLRVSRVASSTTTPPIDPDRVSWKASELLEHLRKIFGVNASWKARPYNELEVFQIRNVNPEFHGTMPNLSVLLKRSVQSTAHQSVRI